MRRTSLFLLVCTAVLTLAASVEAAAQSRGGSRGTTTLGAASLAAPAVSRAQALRAQGKSATEAAATIRAELGTAIVELASAFRQAGYTAAETAMALRDAYTANAVTVVTALARAEFGLSPAVKAVRALYGGGNAGAAELMAALRDTGMFALGDVVKTVSVEYALNAAGTAQAMRAAAVDHEMAADILRTAFNLGAEEAGAALHRAGFQANQVALGMVSAFNATAAQFVAAMLGAGAPAQAVAQTLKQTLKQTDEQVLALLAPRINAVATLVQAMRSGAGTSAADLAKLMRARGSLAKDIAKPMATAYGMGHDATLDALDAAGYDTQQRIEAAHRGLNQGIDYAARYLHRQKVGAANGILIMADEFAANATDAARALMEAGYKVDEIALGLKDALNYTALQTATVLKDLRYNAADIGAAIGKVFQLGVAELAHLLASIGL